MLIEQQNGHGAHSMMGWLERLVVPGAARPVPRHRGAPDAERLRRRSAVSIVCVFNDTGVREQCLDRSLAHAANALPGTELIPVDNTEGAFGTAGSALNYGARQATNEVIAFVHQDVYFHSLPHLEAAATFVAEGHFALLGAVGVDGHNDLVGRVRDRVVLSGDLAWSPSPVDSLDEVLFLVSREQILREPVSESPHLAWHAYAVEYGLRVRSTGGRVGAIQIPLTHNSLTVNLARLDEAHARVGAMYPDLLPIHTTCGTISTGTAGPRKRERLSSQRWRYRWFVDSLVINRACRDLPVRAVLSDIRRDIDGILEELDSPLRVLNVDDEGAFAGSAATELRRHATHLTVEALPFSDVLGAAAQDTGSLLITNLHASALRAVVAVARPRAVTVGYHHDGGLWLAAGPVAGVQHPAWAEPQHQPIKMWG